MDASDNLSERAARDRDLFDAIAGTYARKDLDRACRPARRLRLEQTLAAAPLPPAPRLLEVGCGAGFTARYLAGRYRAYTGIDRSENMVRYARAHNQVEGASFAVASGESYAPGCRFDVVLLVGVLHHLDEIAGTLAHLAGVLEPGGWLIANEPQPANPLIRLARRVRARVDPDYSPEQVEIAAADLRAALAGAGLVDLRIVPQGLFSTPFAEVPLRPEPVAALAARLACAADRAIERRLPRSLLARVTFSLIGAGRRPGEPGR